jgi:hypothetical protein
MRYAAFDPIHRWPICASWPGRLPCQASSKPSRMCST